eukprot:CAMPEP_0174329460 /NCGR_PEP_ID=MMETSP0810-20121108/15869_1 /TAXON_ID=73025 ORGANISM="Eutreptiella gymnastica-like, Strain CCMP1594" /NCGR_SAMPLE_ID=MMETSP0810 /ASSEMBLY_ACC=CAM_ASM_000659 /LENGTH=35 /DNA_ID= /DNA_START= /DNA_END= /DNA_ORIENTATION=
MTLGEIPHNAQEPMRSHGTDNLWAHDIPQTVNQEM